MECRLCGVEARDEVPGRGRPGGERRCARCGRVIETAPQSPGALTFNLKVYDLVGWTEQQLLDRLGPPDEHEVGRFWPSPPGTEGHPYGLMVTREGRVVTDSGRGARQRKIPFPTPYETWRYRMKDSPLVGDSTWTLYLVGAEVAVRDAIAAREGVLGEMAGRLSRRLSERSLKPEGPLKVVEVEYADALKHY